MTEQKHSKSNKLPSHTGLKSYRILSPAYLFWKIQSHITKLANRLLKRKQQEKRDKAQ